MSRSFAEMVEIAAQGGEAAAAQSRDACLQAARTYAAERRKEIRERHNAGESGGNVLRLLSDLADELVHGAFQFAVATLKQPRSAPSHACLVALGGYGRGQMSPGSDLDVCLLYQGRLNDAIQQINSYLVPFLWDTGFTVGYAIRSIRQAKQLIREDMEAYTSALESRFICGRREVFARFKLDVEGLRPGQLAQGFVESKLHDRFDGLPDEYADVFAPEPHIKEGAGGLRDFHTALWLLMTVHGVDSLEDAAAQGILSSDEHLEFAEALEFLWRVRNELHFHANGEQDWVNYQAQWHLAHVLGYEGPNPPGPVRFMQDYYAAASCIRRFLEIVAEHCSVTESAFLPPLRDDEPREDAAIRNGKLFVGLDDDHWFTHQPARLMEVYWRCARRRCALSRSSELRVTASLDLVNDAFRSSDLVRKYFVAICGRPSEAGRVLRQMAQSGLLGAYLPEWSDVEGVLRYEDFHHYPVDEHTLLAIEALTQLDEIGGAVGRCLREAMEELTDPHILVLGILFHDLGKAGGEVHVAEGVRLARVIGQRIGLPDDDLERIVFLVENHMLMNHISQYRDTDEDEIVQSFADLVKTEQRLRALFLLSFADLFAVGPNVWNDWKGTLLLQLYLRTVKRILGQVETVDEDFWNSPKADAMREAAPAHLRPLVADYLRGLGQRYFVAFSPPEVAHHLACLETAKETGLCVRAIDNPGGLRTEVVICTRDRRGLFAQIAGAFSSHLVDIISASLFTHEEGWVTDVFTVTDARQRRAVTPAQLRAVDRTLRSVLFDGKDIGELLERSRRRLFGLLQPRMPVPTRVAFEESPSRLYTIIDVETGDRTGLLYDIVHALTELGLDIAMARIVTDARRVRDSFYVRPAKGEPKPQFDQEAVGAALTNAVHPRPAVESTPTRKTLIGDKS